MLKLGPIVSLLALLGTVFVARAASAQDAARWEALAGAGLSFRHTTDIDLAREAGAQGYGSGSDTSPGALGFELRAGLLTPFSLELDGMASIAVGGLNLARIERRYFDGGPEQIGSSLAAAADGSIRYAPLLTPDLRLLVGPGVGVQRLVASSPPGSARVDLLGAGLDAGLRYRLNSIARVVDGHLEFVGRIRREFPMGLRVGHGADRALFAGTGGGDAIYSIGVSVGYVFSFHEAAEGR